MTAQKSFDVAAGGSQVLYFRGHPQYDALRVEFDGANSGSTAVDVTYNADTRNNLDDVEADGFGAMDYTVSTATGLDASAGVNDGETGLARTVAVEVNETGGTSGAQGAVYAHNESDPAENADAFASR